MAKTETPRSTWSKIADRLDNGTAQAIEDNATELGFEIDSDAWFAECIGQANA